MIKADIINQISNDTKLPRADTAVVVEEIIKAIKESLAKGERMELRNFGVFMVKKRVARIGRNPKTKVEAGIPPRKVPIFKPGRELKMMLNPKPTK
jgi:nucleoid DNA-binding protein